MSQLEIEKFFKFESTFCFFQSRQILWEVKFFDGFFSAYEFIFLNYAEGEVFGDIVTGVINGILGGGDQKFIFQFFSTESFGEGVNGD